MAEDQDSKKHDPTSNKLDEERKKGNVLKVQDAMVAAMLFVGAYALTFTGQLVYQWIFKFIIETYQTIPEFKTLTYLQTLQLLARAAILIAITTAPFLLMMVLTAVVVMYAQVGWLITFKPLEPKFEKIDPVKGFKNKINPFKIKQLFNLTKTFAVMSLIGYIVYSVIRDNMPAILQSMTLSTAGSMALMGSLLITVAQKVAIAMLVVAFISYMFERWQWWKGMKMSDKEIKDEYKKLEGDPHIKAKQRQKGMEIAMGAAAEAMEKADVVITNPTHYAVALEYKPNRGQKAPTVVAKGKDRTALMIRQLAEENFIPIVEDPPTARALHAQVKVGQIIPPDLFVAVAKIIASIMRKRQRQTVIPAAPPSLTGYAPVIIEPAPAGFAPTGSEAEPPAPPAQAPEVESEPSGSETEGPSGPPPAGV